MRLQLVYNTQKGLWVYTLKVGGYSSWNLSYRINVSSICLTINTNLIERHDFFNNMGNSGLALEMLDCNLNIKKVL